MARILGARQAQPITDLFLLLGRVTVGVILIAHGWQKVDEQGFAATADGFDQLGIPAPDAAAAFAIGTELGGGTLLILGLLSPLAGIAIAAMMAGAYWYVHKGHGVFVGDGGWELVAVIGASALALGMCPGRLSLDQLFFGRRKTADEHSPARESVPA